MTISAFYGTSDKGATESGWDSNVTLSGAQSAGDVAIYFERSLRQHQLCIPDQSE